MNANGGTSKFKENKAVFLLCLAGAIHVFIFSAAFPFFNNVDEQAHFDLVLKYAHGHIPRGLEMISEDSAKYIALMSSDAFNKKPAAFPGGTMPPPLWTEPGDKMKEDLAAKQAGWQKLANYESAQCPLYYVLAGSWWNIGQFFGFSAPRLVYWVRFFNVLLMVGLVWLSYAAMRLVFPENRFVQLGVPALAAFMPQTAFYSISNDMLSALCFGVTFICLVRWLQSPNPTWREGAATGLAFAATYLTKITNLPLLVIVAAAILIKIRQGLGQGKSRAVFPALLAFLVCAVPPIAAWMLWSASHYGDFSGAKLNALFFGWTIKPPSEWWHHPIFTPAGLWTYLSGELGAFWEGEFWWHLQTMALPGTMGFYTILSLALLVVALSGCFSQTNDISQRQALFLSSVLFFAILGFFAFLSIIYDFHDAPNQSRAHPYYSQGRLMLGMLIPFLLLIVYALDKILNRSGNTAKFSILVLIISAQLVLEIVTDRPVFSNPYNWFHLP